MAHRLTLARVRGLRPFKPIGKNSHLSIHRLDVYLELDVCILRSGELGGSRDRQDTQRSSPARAPVPRYEDHPDYDVGNRLRGICPADGLPVILMHGFPDDVHAYDGVAPPLAASGWRVIVPYLRGYGPTRFRDPATPRSGQQGALGQDLLSLMDGLSVRRAVLAGYDWGGRAACIVAALWPERVAGLVSITGYNIQNIATALQPASPDAEYRYWYQWYFHTERGRAGLSANRRLWPRSLA
jgi:pimeloyl-ACP methyl ester carboxylesterase